MLAATVNQGAAWERCLHPRAKAGCWHYDCLPHCVLGTGEGRAPCPQAALVLHSQDRLNTPAVSYRAGEQVCPRERRIFSLVLPGDMCSLRCPCLPPVLLQPQIPWEGAWSRDPRHTA